MNGSSRVTHGFLSIAAIAFVFLCGSLPGPTRAPLIPQLANVHGVAAETDNHADDQDKSEPTRSGLHRIGLLNADPSSLASVAGSLVGALERVALSPNRTIVQSEMQGVAGGQVSDFEVTCPYPFKIVNGGESNTGQNVRLTKNFPVTTPSSSGWHVQVHNEDTVARNYRVYADCINGLTQYQRITMQSHEIGPNTRADDFISCPSGTAALGGGYSFDMSDRFAVTESYSVINSWIFNTWNIDGPPARISLYAMCVSGVSGLDFAGAEADSAEPYGHVEVNCEAPRESFAGGWNIHTDSYYIVVTDSYPNATGGQVVWARNPNNSRWKGDLLCGTGP